MSIRTPQVQHEKAHRQPEAPVSECWECQRERGKCRSKRRFPDREAVYAVAQEENVKSDWRLMLIGYPCPWCAAYHLTRAKPGSVRWKRVEKRRRRWLTEQRIERDRREAKTFLVGLVLADRARRHAVALATPPTPETPAERVQGEAGEVAE